MKGRNPFHSASLALLCTAALVGCTSNTCTDSVCGKGIHGGRVNDGQSPEVRERAPGTDFTAPDKERSSQSPLDAAPYESGDASRYAEFDKFLSSVDEIAVGDGNGVDLDSGRLNQTDSAADVRLSFARLEYGAQHGMSSRVRVGWIANDELPDCAGRANLDGDLDQAFGLIPRWGEKEAPQWDTHSVCIYTTSGQWMLLRVLEGRGGTSDFRFRYGPLK